jgi:hypothetical protein
MISAEAPVLFAKACEMFIHELTLRAWIHTDENKRRTLQVAHPSLHSVMLTPSPSRRPCFVTSLFSPV